MAGDVVGAPPLTTPVFSVSKSVERKLGRFLRRRRLWTSLTAANSRRMIRRKSVATTTTTEISSPAVRLATLGADVLLVGGGWRVPFTLLSKVVRWLL